MTEYPKDQLHSFVTDEEQPLPVIATLMDPFAASTTDHAVVVTDIRQGEQGGSPVEVVEYMDPLTGDVREDASGRFWQQWDFAGRRAFVIWP